MNARTGKALGFTLIELMIVVVIIGILSAIAIPSYRTYVIRTNRAAARSCMLETTQLMERWYTTRLTYVGAVPASGLPGLGCETDGNLNTRYTITVGTLAQNTYTVTATPVGAQLSGDAACGVLTLDQAGGRNATGSSGRTTCWSR